MFRCSFLLGRANLVRLLQHHNQHDPSSSNTSIQFVPDFGAQFSTVGTQPTPPHSQLAQLPPHFHRFNHISDRLLNASFLFRRQAQHNQTQIIYSQRPSDSYIEEVMTIPDDSNYKKNANTTANTPKASGTNHKHYGTKTKGFSLVKDY